VCGVISLYIYIFRDFGQTQSTTEETIDIIMLIPSNNNMITILGIKIQKTIKLLKNHDGQQGKDPFSMVNISMIVFFCCIIFCFQGEQTYVYKKNYRTV
jgi:hypothetical protein